MPLNKRWTFRSAARSRWAPLGYAGLVVAAFGANLWITLATHGAGLAYPLARPLGAAPCSATVFAGLKWMVFRDA